MFYSLENCKNIAVEYNQLNQKYSDLLSEYQMTHSKVFSAHSLAYINHGFLRRIATLRRCIHNIFNICPISKSEKPTDDELKDLAINLQSFIANCFGCMDNLAWIWVFETAFDYEGKDTKVSFFTNKKIRQKLSPEFLKYLNTLNDWRDNLKEFRDALAHKIPLYVPATENSNFFPVMSHSIQSNKFVKFHAQLLADWNTIIELSDAFIQELKHQKTVCENH